jgi:twitching motility protein PilT
VEVEGFMPALTPQHVEAIALKIMGSNERLASDLKNFGSCDTSYAVPNLARFRVNIFKNNGNHAIVMRKLSTQIPTLDGLKLPPIFREIDQGEDRHRLRHRRHRQRQDDDARGDAQRVNQQQEITWSRSEDPIEFLHPHIKATFSQRELGKDFSDFSVGLRARVASGAEGHPRGEIRDRETMEIALTAAETGHIVLFDAAHHQRVAVDQPRHRHVHERRGRIRSASGSRTPSLTSSASGLRRRSAVGACMVSEIMGSNLRTRERSCSGERHPQFPRDHRIQLPERLAQLRAVADQALQGEPHHRGERRCSTASTSPRCARRSTSPRRACRAKTRRHRASGSISKHCTSHPGTTAPLPSKAS